MKILIGADLVPTDSNQALFAAGDGETLVGEALLSCLNSADMRIFNLEVPLTDVASPIEKCGPNLIAPTASVAGYKALGADILTLANNHIMDQGEQGFFSTLEALGKSGIEYIGADRNAMLAALPGIFPVGDKTIGIYACAEHEFSIAGENTPGANPFDPLESPDHVAALKKQCDYVIVLYHGGKEHYRYPSPGLQKVCRKLVEKGADLVLCQHSHCIGCEEKYLHGTIVYGQGNFLFDHSKSEFWQTSLLVQIGDSFEISYIPLQKKENTVRLAAGEDADMILAEFYSRSEQLRKPDFVGQEYARFAQCVQDYYLLHLSGIRVESFFFRVVNKLTGYRWGKWRIKRAYQKKKRLVLRNFMECEAHAELLRKGLEE